jgi:hypothetical protein
MKRLDWVTRADDSTLPEARFNGNAKGEAEQTEALFPGDETAEAWTSIFGAQPSMLYALAGLTMIA